MYRSRSVTHLQVHGGSRSTSWTLIVVANGENIGEPLLILCNRDNVTLSCMYLTALHPTEVTGTPTTTDHTSAGWLPYSWMANE